MDMEIRHLDKTTSLEHKGNQSTVLFVYLPEIAPTHRWFWSTVHLLVFDQLGMDNLLKEGCYTTKPGQSLLFFVFEGQALAFEGGSDFPTQHTSCMCYCYMMLLLDPSREYKP